MNMDSGRPRREPEASYADCPMHTLNIHFSIGVEVSIPASPGISNPQRISNIHRAIPYVGFDLYFDLYNESLFIDPSKQKGFDSLSKLAHNQSILNSSAL